MDFCRGITIRTATELPMAGARNFCRCSAGELARTIGDAVSVIIEQRSNVAAACDDDIAMGIERHGINIIRQRSVRVLRHAKTARDSQPEIIDGDEILPGG